MELLGRQSSHYTRMVRMVAAELEFALALAPIHDLMSQDPAVFGGHPALKLPVLRIGEDRVFGSLNICRVIALHAGRYDEVAWPETSLDPLQLDAQELVANAMGMHTELVMHEVVARREPDLASRKRRAGLVGSLQWLDGRWAEIRDGQPPRAVSVLEVSLFCLLEHIPFRNPMDLSAFPALLAFVREFGARPSARATPYRFDAAA